MVHYLFASEEQRDYANTAREILEKELAPQLKELEAKEDFPLDVYKTLAAADFCSMSVPERWGGLGMDYKTQAIVLEEMAQVDAGFSFAFGIACGQANNELFELTGMSKEEKQKIYDGVMSGDLIWATALTEADAGSDTRNIRTTAVLDGDEWVLNGTKTFISNGPIANIFIISAYVDKSKGAAGIAQFFVEKERGVVAGKKEDKMGLRVSVTSELVLDDVRIPKDHMVGSIYTLRPEDAKELPANNLKGNALMLQHLAVARITNMIHALGIGQRALDEAVAYAKERRTFGSRIIDHQGLGFLIADMQMKIDAARALIYYSIDALDQGIQTGTLSPSTKVFVSEEMLGVTMDAIQVLGGYGYMKDYPVEKLARDIKIFSIFEGTNQINRMVSQRMLAGRDTKR